MCVAVLATHLIEVEVSPEGERVLYVQLIGLFLSPFLIRDSVLP